MCDIKRNHKSAVGGGVHLSMTCETSGKPITVSNEYGVFCEDLCDLQENKDAREKLNQMFPGLFE